MWTKDAVERDRQAEDESLQLTPGDRKIIGQVERSLRIGRELKQWWRGAHLHDGYRQRFPLVQSHNRPEESFGFFDVAPSSEGDLHVMGDYQVMMFDQAKSLSLPSWQASFREFVLRYFMRVSDFRQPRAVARRGQTAAPALAAFSLCPDEGIEREGFGYTQLYFQRRSGETGKFLGNRRFAVSDLRTLGTRYDWIVCRVRIFNFNLRFRPLGINGPEVALPLIEDTYVVLAADFIANSDHPSPGVLGEYGFGYTVFSDPNSNGLLAYGPGQFGAGFQLITFRMRADGEVRAELVFVVNRPERLLRPAFNPLAWPFQLADTFSLSSAPARPSLARRLAESPILSGLNLFNALTANLPDRWLCLSREQLEITMLVQHFMQHYEMVTGSLLTWRQIGDWFDEASMPSWVKSGISS